SAARDAYEQARRKYSAGDKNNPALEKSLVDTRKGYCDCLKRKYKGKLPADLERFCNPKNYKLADMPPAETFVPEKPREGAAKKNILIGLVVPSGMRPNEEFTSKVVTDPDTFANAPGIDLIRVEVPVEIDETGTPVLDDLYIETGDGVKQPANDLFHCKLSEDIRDIRLKVFDDEQQLLERELPLEPPRENDPEQFQTSPVCVKGGAQTVRGPFDGDASNTGADMNGGELEVVAESPRSLVYRLPERITSGPNILMVREGDTAVEFPIAILELTLTAERLTLQRGESTSFKAIVSGFENLSDSAWQSGEVLLILQNASPETVSLSGAENEALTLKIKKSAVKDGRYEYKGKIRSKQAGTFNIQGRVIPMLALISGKQIEN
ncbi:MAG TPA: hypothetical protein VI958_04905, partial [Acidobacteriota bacterium]